jgi:hypothetical protein
MMNNKILTPAEVMNLQNLVMDIFTVMEGDQDGQLVDLYEPTLVAAEILGVTIPGA